MTEEDLVEGAKMLGIYDLTEKAVESSVLSI
ncbi:hypothetical protein IPdc08_01188 [archaeon]|nr:hypothetical protein IPdc08_01188 [archaeon]